jgi:hypothetical protein
MAMVSWLKLRILAVITTRANIVHTPAKFLTQTIHCSLYKYTEPVVSVNHLIHK